MLTLRTAAVLAMSAFALPAAHADAFIAVNLFGNPKSDYRTWNSDDPQNSLTYVGELPTLFIYGLYMDSPTSGYYLSPYTDHGDPTGFFRLENGLSTKIASVPFHTPALTGLVLEPGGQYFLTMLDRDWFDDDVPYEIYRVDFDGTFTFLTAVTMPGDKSVEFRGLARNPVTGEYFSVEMNYPPQDRLCKIDITTGLVTVVGHVGVNAQSNGGLAFTADGQHLYFAIGFGHLYELDQETGVPTERADWPINTESLALIPSNACYPDFTGDGALDLFDFLAYVNAFNAGEDGADCTGDGARDLFDFLCFVNAFNAGC